MNKITKQTEGISIPDRVMIPFIGGDKPSRNVILNFHRIIDSAVLIAYNGQRKIEWEEIISDNDDFDEDKVNIFRDCIAGMKSPVYDTVGGQISYPGSNLFRELDLYACCQPIRYLKGLKTTLKNPEELNLFLFTGGTEYAHDDIEWEYARVIKSAIDFAIRRGLPSINVVHSKDMTSSMEWAFKVWAYEIADKEYGDYTFSMNIYKSLFNIWGKDVADEELEKAKRTGKVIIRDDSIEGFLDDVSENPQRHSVVLALTCCGDYISDELTKMIGGAGILPKVYYNSESGFILFESMFMTSLEVSQRGLVNFIPDLLSGIMLLEYMKWNEAAKLIMDVLEDNTCKKSMGSKNSKNTLVGRRFLMPKVRNMFFPNKITCC